MTESRALRIIYHHRTLGDGAEGIHVREMIQAFRSLGHEVRVAGPVGEEQPGASRKAAFLSRVKGLVPKAFFELLECAYAVYSYAAIRRTSASFRPDFIYDRYTLFNAGPVLAGRALRIPVFLEVNAPLAWERAHEPDEVLFLRRPAAAAERWICSLATKTLVVSTPLFDHLATTGVPRAKMIVLPNGVDPVKFSPRPKDGELGEGLGIRGDDVVVGFTGVLRPWHGLEMLAQAVGRLVGEGKKLFLLVVGDGPSRPDLEMAIDAAGIAGRAAITGRVSHEEVVRFANLFDIAVSVKSTFYASPMKVVEYMALGKTVLVPDAPNFLDLVDPGTTGMVFRDNDPVSLADALRQLYEDPKFRRDLGAAALQKVETRLNWGWNARNVCDEARRQKISVLAR